MIGKIPSHYQIAAKVLPFRSKALAEMYRVLVPGGSVAVSVFRGLEKNPYPAALLSAVTRHLGGDTAKQFHAPYSFEDRDDLGSLLGRAGFRDVKIDYVELQMQVSQPREFIIGHLSIFGFFPALMAKSLGLRRLRFLGPLSRVWLCGT
jgi:hypothetical protein